VQIRIRDDDGSHGKAIVCLVLFFKRKKQEEEEKKKAEKAGERGSED
jgi:hypothetical protein